MPAEGAEPVLELECDFEFFLESHKPARPKRVTTAL
jgi:hypothetical protein